MDSLKMNSATFAYRRIFREDFKLFKYDGSKPEHEKRNEG